MDPAAGLRRARAATLLMLALPGSAYLYQGEELGLPEVADLPVEVLQDPIWEQTGHVRKGRDGCRVPLPWTATGPSYGFGPGAGWLPQPASFAAYAVEAQAGTEGSTLELYRTALQAAPQAAGGRDADLERGRAARRAGLRPQRGLAQRHQPGHRAGAAAGGRGPAQQHPAAGGRTLPPDTTVWLA